MQNRIYCRTSRVSDFELHGVRNSQNGRIAVLGFTIAGRLALPSRSFWRWLIAQFPETVRFSTHDGEQTLDQAEFFHRLRDLQPQAEVHYEMARDEEGNAVLMAPRDRTAKHQIGHSRMTHCDRRDGDAYYMSASWAHHGFR